MLLENTFQAVDEVMAVDSERKYFGRIMDVTPTHISIMWGSITVQTTHLYSMSQVHELNICKLCKNSNPAQM